MRLLISYTLTLSLLITPTVLHAQETGPTPIREKMQTVLKLKNVELTQNGELLGQYLDQTGQPLAGVAVTVTVNKAQHEAKTDEQGRLKIEGLKGGRAIIRVGEQVFACQLWSHGTSPPNSIHSIAMVKASDEVVLGNRGHVRKPVNHHHHMKHSRLLGLSTKQLLALGIIAGGTTAIAVGANKDDNKNASI